uniref:Putative GT2: distantly related to N-acetylglucosaminyltransferase n=1 Tax=Magnetococcus massalia (strain MO-1) TaxID=451514 RepID=A0A1S7LJX5_MAGMO|nr:putative GT2 : distantly related to N-acetylglucosaminyltransferase [Candidatus Magnetococcus massalia]
MTELLVILFWSGLGAILYIWLGYPLLLKLLASLSPDPAADTPPEPLPMVTVIIAAFNEGPRIASRIENLLAQDYPVEKLEILIGSDGSSDDTVAQVERFSTQHPHVKMLDFKQNRGRAGVHNHCVTEATGEVLLFTDAETRFANDYVRRLAEAFTDPSVGYASGELGYSNTASGEIAQSAGLYWRFELMLRRLETRLGIHAFGSGPCCAMRKSLFRQLPPTGDVDFTSPLDAVLQKSSCLFVEAAKASDVLPETSSQELKARVRMTSKNFGGTLSRWGWANLLRHPIYSWVILSHKIGRWLTPFFALLVGLATLLLVMGDGAPLYYGMAGFELLFLLLGWAGRAGLPIPLSGAIYSFILANIGFFLGVLKSLAGRAPATYTPINQTR